MCSSDLQSPVAAAQAASPAQTPQEKEAVRWARELVKGTELRSVRNLSGARFAALLRIQGAGWLRSGRLVAPGAP